MCHCVLLQGELFDMSNLTGIHTDLHLPVHNVVNGSGEDKDVKVLLLVTFPPSCLIPHCLLPCSLIHPLFFSSSLAYSFLTHTCFPKPGSKRRRTVDKTEETQPKIIG